MEKDLRFSDSARDSIQLRFAMSMLRYIFRTSLERVVILQFCYSSTVLFDSTIMQFLRFWGSRRILDSKFPCICVFWFLALKRKIMHQPLLQSEMQSRHFHITSFVAPFLNCFPITSAWIHYKVHWAVLQWCWSLNLLNCNISMYMYFLHTVLLTFLYENDRRIW